MQFCKVVDDVVGTLLRNGYPWKNSINSLQSRWKKSSELLEYHWEKGIFVREAVWFSIHDQMELYNCVDMDKVRLRVKTVPVSDLITHTTNTLYTVIKDDGDGVFVKCASGMTLQEAIENFCLWFKADRKSVKLIRPFLPIRREDCCEKC